MSVNFVEGKDPSLCAARRCQKEATDEYEGTPVCGKHLSKLTDAPAPAARPVSTAITAEIQTQVQEAESDAREDLEALREWELETQDDLEQADGFVKQLHEEVKRLTGIRNDLLEPIKESKKRVEALFNPAIKLRTESKSILQGKIRAVALAEVAANAEAIKVGDHTAITSVADLPNTSVQTDGWEAREVDFSQVPDEYKCLDWSAIKLLCKEHKGKDAPVVPGLEFVRAASSRVK